MVRNNDNDNSISIIDGGDSEDDDSQSDFTNKTKTTSSYNIYVKTGKFSSPLEWLLLLVAGASKASQIKPHLYSLCSAIIIV